MKLSLIFVLAIVAALTAAEPLPPPQVVRLLNKHSGKYITVGTQKTEAGGVELLQQPKNDSAGQKWIARPVAPPPSTSQPMPRFIYVSTSEDKAMGIRYQSSITGAPACLWWPGYGPTETFRILPVEDGWFYLENYTSGKVLGVLGASTADGAKIVQWGLNKSDDQKWKMEPVK